jgi:amino acid transporter
MIPLTFLAVIWIFTGNFDFGNVTSFEHLDGSGFFSSFTGHGWIYVCLAYSFLLTWNVLAMEAAACYIGECRDPARDAKIAMTLEGSYGLFIYTLIPVGFVAVLGATARSPTRTSSIRTRCSSASRARRSASAARHWTGSSPSC